MVVTVMPISESHTASFWTCLDTVAQERCYLAATRALPIDQVTTFVQGNIRNGVSQFVALDGSQVIGWADIVPAWPDATAHCGRLGMGLLRAYRGQGIGRRLLEACLAKAWRNGITRVELEVRADNLPAIRLYEQFGFTVEAVKRRAMRFDGAYYDAIQMSLLSQEV